jgi:hypothetical protein
LTQSELDRILSGEAKLGLLTLTRVSAVTPSQTGGVMVTRTASASSAFVELSGPDLRYYFADRARPEIPILIPPPVGECSVIETSSVAAFVPSPPSTFYDLAIRSLDAGESLSLQGPGGASSIPRITNTSSFPYLYLGSFPEANLLSGSYTFSGPGSVDLGAFRSTFDLTAPLVWTNRESLDTVTRADGMRVTWSGGDPAQQVSIVGISSNLDVSTSITTTAAFVCIANQGDGSFTVPGSILSRLPPTGSLGSFVGPGIVSLAGANTVVRADLPGLDYFYVTTSSTESIPVVLR